MPFYICIVISELGPRDNGRVNLTLLSRQLFLLLLHKWALSSHESADLEIRRSCWLRPFHQLSSLSCLVYRINNSGQVTISNTWWSLHSCIGKSVHKDWRLLAWKRLTDIESILYNPNIIIFSHFHTGLQGPTMQFPYNKNQSNYEKYS